MNISRSHKNIIVSKDDAYELSEMLEEAANYLEHRKGIMAREFSKKFCNLADEIR